MANFVGIVDGNAERRRRYVRTIRPALALMDALRLDEIEVGDFAVAWAAQDRAPISRACSSAAASIVWGDAIPPHQSERLDATQLASEWTPRATAPPPAFDGFYAALHFDAQQGLVLGADVLGFFPIYYASRNGTLLIGTSPHLFREHPSFPARLSLAGLTGILLTHAPFGGGTLVDGVRRLSPGHALTWVRGAEPNEVRQYAIPVSTTANRLSFGAAVKQLDGALASAVDRHMPCDRRPGMLLSGGRDSRLLAGYLREHGDGIHALTLGADTDYEMKCAKAVARALRSTHRTTNVDENHLPLFAELQARWEQLGTGFANVHMWGAVAPLRELPARFFSGYNLESRSGEPMPPAFDELFGGVKNRGFPPATLERLLRRDVFGDLVDIVEQERKAVYETGAAIAADRPTRFFIAHDWRAHAGGVPWKLCFGSWPILPILDRGVLETIFALPASALANRRAQDEILRRRFPDLARLPLDRNTNDTLPLLPSVAQRIGHVVSRAAEPIGRRIPRRRERRYYHRVYDMNGPGWRGIRRLAEPFRDGLSTFFNMDVLAELVPQPDARIPVRSAISEGFGTKLLIGLMIWSAQHLS